MTLNKSVILSDDFSCRGIGKAGVKTHRRASVGSQLGDGCPCAGALIFPQRVGFVTGCTPDVARLQCPFTKVIVFQVGIICRATGAVPEIILILCPESGRQQAAFVPVDLAEIAKVIPLSDDQPWLQRTAVSDEHLVKTILGGHL